MLTRHYALYDLGFDLGSKYGYEQYQSYRKKHVPGVSWQRLLLRNKVVRVDDAYVSPFIFDYQSK